MKVARTVLSGGKTVMSYLSLQTLSSLTISSYCLELEGIEVVEIRKPYAYVTIGIWNKP